MCMEQVMAPIIKIVGDDGRCFAVMNSSGSLTSGTCPPLRLRTSSLTTPAMLADGMRRLLAGSGRGCS
jgi:hypothetical protein